MRPCTPVEDLASNSAWTGYSSTWGDRQLKQKRTSVGSTQSIGIRSYTHQHLRGPRGESGKVLMQVLSSYVFEDKTLARADPDLGSSRLFRQSPRGLNRSIRPAGGHLASRSALVPLHFQGSVTASRAIIP
jgi:hypothetical protein